MDTMDKHVLIEKIRSLEGLTPEEKSDLLALLRQPLVSG